MIAELGTGRGQLSLRRRIDGLQKGQLSKQRVKKDVESDGTCMIQPASKMQWPQEKRSRAHRTSVGVEVDF
ncbi:MAG: hypothetical protein L6R37_008020 [Teloschistes peruensis]|nr:MAG: hypothetical protein L6R37_008020 [Teloschistes peruensis]